MLRRGWLGRKKRVVIAAILVFLVAAAVAAFQLVKTMGTPEVPTAEVEKGEFLITITESGELKAAKGEEIVAPRVHIRGGLKIVKLWPEGQKVDVGDLIIEFDREDIYKMVIDAEGELEKAEAEMDKGLASQESRIAELESAIEDKRSALRLQEINLQKMRYEAVVEVEKAKLELKRAQLALEQAKQDLETQKIVNKVERAKLDLNIAQKRERLERAKREYESLSIRATKPGIVVYKKIWKGGRREKIRVGDSRIWSGHALVDLPDLSVMQVETQINEVDVRKVEVGQRVLIKLDAFPEPTFHGEVTDIAPLAGPQEDARSVQVFRVTITIDEQDERLKPGMSAMAEIIIESIPDVVYVPIESVFERDGKAVVYVMDGSSPRMREVEVGGRNDSYVIIEEGLEGGDRVALALKGR